MTYEEKIEGLKQKRSNAINQKVSSQISRLDVVDEDNFNNKYLWGDGTNIGIQDLIKLYYQEKNIEVGRTWNSPSLSNYTESYWETLLNNSIDQDGDGTNGFYPDSNSDGIADEDINTSSPYLNDNGDNGETSNGLYIPIDNLDEYIGQNATTTGTYTGPGGYATESEAQTAAETYLYGSDLIEGTADDNIDRIGSKIRGRRTRDVEIVITGIGPYNYEIGNGSVDQSSFFADTTDINGYGGGEKTEFLSRLNILIADLENYRDNNIIILRDELNKIFDGTNELFDDMKVDIIDDSNNLDILISNLNSYIGTSADTVIDNSLYGYYNYFNTASGSEADFNTQLTNLETLNSNIETEITNRTTNLLNTYVGDTYSDIMKKWRYFWIKERIGKPVSSLISIQGIDKGIANAEENILNNNETLSTLFGNADVDRQEWIPTPEVYNAFFNPLINSEDGSIINRKGCIIYSGQQHATKYEIYRDLIENITLTNDPWAIELKINDYTELNENGFVKYSYEDSNVIEGNSYVYRIRVYDDTNDSNYIFSGSIQSKIFDDNDPINYSFVLDENIPYNGINTESSKLTVSKDRDFTLNSRIILFSSSGNNDDIYRIIKVQEYETEKNIWITPSLPVEENGNIYYFKCVAEIS